MCVNIFYNYETWQNDIVNKEDRKIYKSHETLFEYC